MNIKLFSLVSICCLVLPMTALQAADIPVAPGESIQSAIDSAVDGDTILVAPGTYTENIDFKGRAVSLQSTGGASVTTIDGGAAGPVVTFSSWEQRDSVLDGFTITNGTGAPLPGADCGQGGGILCLGSSPTILNCIVTGNRADAASGLFGLGGGVCLLDGACPEIRYTTISSNRAESGGGLYIYKHLDPNGYGLDAILIEHCSIESNEAQVGGGLFICGNAAPSLTGTTLSGNSAVIEQDSVYLCDGSEYTIITLASFEARARMGGKIELRWSTAAEISNAGFNLYRATAENGPYEKITPALIPARGSATRGADYTYPDTGLKPGTRYWYRLEDVDLDGNATTHGPTSATARLLPGPPAREN